MPTQPTLALSRVNTPQSVATCREQWAQRRGPVAVVDAGGKRVSEHSDRDQRPSAGGVLADDPRQRHVCLEDGTQSGWLYEILSPHAQEMGVANVTASCARR